MKFRNFCIGAWACLFFALAYIAAAIIMCFEWITHKKN